MSNSKSRQQNFTVVLFLIYLFFVVWMVLFKADFSIEGSPEIRSLNLIPFSGSAIVNGQANISEILSNMAIFIPFGIYISLVFPAWSFIKKWLPIVACSALFEILQYALAIGRSDITDLISNSLGGAVGILMIFILMRILKSHTKTAKLVNIIMCAGTSLLGVLTVLLVLNNPA